MIIAPDDPGEASPLENLNSNVTRVFDGDGFMADVWNPMRNTWLGGIPIRFAFIDAPEMGQPGGEDARDFLAALIVGKTLRLDPIGKESSGYLPVDSYKRLLCMLDPSISSQAPLEARGLSGQAVLRALIAAATQVVRLLLM